MLNVGLLAKQCKSRRSAGKLHFLGIFIILGSGITLWILLTSRGSDGCLGVGGEGAVPRPASSHSPGTKKGSVLRLHVRPLQLHYWITLTGRPLVSYFITWVKKNGLGGRKFIFSLSEHQQVSHPQKQPQNIYTAHVGKSSVRLESLKFGVKAFYWGSGNRP